MNLQIRINPADAFGDFLRVSRFHEQAIPADAGMAFRIFLDVARSVIGQSNALKTFRSVEGGDLGQLRDLFFQRLFSGPLCGQAFRRNRVFAVQFPFESVFLLPLVQQKLVVFLFLVQELVEILCQSPAQRRFVT